MPEYQIKDWGKNFENNRTRELKRMEFVLVPNKHDGDGFRTLISKPRGTALFGAWVLILEVASKCEPRGRLIRSDGSPHTASSIARMTGGDEKLIKAALDILILPEIGWIEDAAANIDFETPPGRTASVGDKRKAIGRLDRFLVADRGVSTPKGKMTERPLECQWCDRTPEPACTGQPGIVAHHLLGYGNMSDDLAVIFVCRSCHGFFESGKYTTNQVIKKYGSEWAPRNIAGDSGVIAGDSGPHARALNGMERNGTERNGTESSSRTQGAVVTVPQHGDDDPQIIAKELVNEIFPNHPEPCDKSMAESAADREMAKYPEQNPRRIAESWRTTHAEHVKFWQQKRELDPRAYVPHLHMWFAKGIYLQTRIHAARAPGRETRRSSVQALLEIENRK